MATTKRRRRRDDDEDDAPRRKKKSSSRDRPSSKKSSKKKSGGLTVKTWGGLNEKRMAAKSGSANDKIYLIKDKTVTVQFAAPPDDGRYWKEYEQHVFREGGGWQFVPCAGDDCPLCEDEDSDVSRTAYVFAAVAWDCNRKKIGVLQGPNNLSMRLLKRYKSLVQNGKEARFVKKTWDITKLDTKPVGYDVDNGSKGFHRLDPKDKKYDLDAWVQREMERYYGEDMPGSSSGGKRRTSLDDDDDGGDEDEGYTRSELKAMEPRKVKKIARRLDIDTEGLNIRSIINAILEEQE